MFNFLRNSIHNNKDRGKEKKPLAIKAGPEWDDQDHYINSNMYDSKATILKQDLFEEKTFHAPTSKIYPDLRNLQLSDQIPFPQIDQVETNFDKFKGIEIKESTPRINKFQSSQVIFNFNIEMELRIKVKGKIGDLRDLACLLMNMKEDYSGDGEMKPFWILMSLMALPHLTENHNERYEYVDNKEDESVYTGIVIDSHTLFCLTKGEIPNYSNWSDEYKWNYKKLKTHWRIKGTFRKTSMRSSPIRINDEESFQSCTRELGLSTYLTEEKELVLFLS